MSRNIFYLLILSIFIIFLALWFVPFSKPLPVYLDMAEAYLHGKSQLPYHWPAGYPLFLVPILVVGNIQGVVIMQGALYSTSVLICRALLRLRGVPEKIACLTAAAIALHPFLVINIKRITDMAIYIFFVVLLFYLTQLVKIKSYPIWGALIGIVFGYAILTRPPLLSTSPVLALIFFIGMKGQTLQKGLKILALFVVSAVVFFGGNYVIRQNWEPVSSYYGAYNLYIGANPRAANEYLKNYQGESAVYEALKDSGIQMLDHGVDNTRMEKIYKNEATKFIKKYPTEYAKLAVIKIITFFRPDYRRAHFLDGTMGMVKAVAQTVLALPVMLWLIVRIRNWKNEGVLGDGVMTCIFVILYLTPYALTVSDPRYRLPLDVFMILDLVSSRWGSVARNEVAS